MDSGSKRRKKNNYIAKQKKKRMNNQFALHARQLNKIKNYIFISAFPSIKTVDSSFENYIVLFLK
jgi:hypothetical protein